MNVFKTIRFKLTFWYSLLLILLSFIFVLSVNIVITSYFNRDAFQMPLPPKVFENKPGLVIKIEQFDEENKEIFNEYRKQDLRTIRRISLFSFIPLTLMSFGGGYLISEQMLSPLKKLNKATTDITAKNLNKRIQHEDTGDEISELINNFNNMTLRLHDSFELQKQFVENASHELRTPLAVIQTNLDAALVDGRVSKTELINVINKSRKSTKFMNKLVEDLLLLSMLENHIPKNVVNLNDLLLNSVEQLRILAGEKQLDLKLDIKKNNKVYTNGNKYLLQRAIMNIIENAIKYSSKKGKVEISLSLKKDEVLIYIKDNGEGIPKKELSKIFERFYRVDKSRSRQTGGSGLGLAITKKIIEMHGGIVRVSSKAGKGSEFVVILPHL